MKTKMILILGILLIVSSPIIATGENPVAHYMLDDTEGNVAADITENGHNGTIFSAPTWVDGPVEDSKALWLGGINGNYVDLGTLNPTEGTDELSISLWAYWIGNNGNYQAILSKMDDWSKQMWHFFVDMQDRIVINSRNSRLEFESTMPVGEWTHIAVTVSKAESDNAVLYINGTAIETGTFSMAEDTDTKFTIAWDVAGANCFNGSLYDIQLYNRSLSPDDIMALLGGETSVQDGNALPQAIVVEQNSPNPFNPTTTINFTIAETDNVSIDVFNVAGQMVDTIVSEYMSAGSHSVTWDATGFSAGVYFYTVNSGDFSKTVKMTLLK